MTVCSTDTDRMSVIFPSHEMMMLVAVPSSNFFCILFPDCSVRIGFTSRQS